MISFIKFGLANGGGMFIASEVLFLLDIIGIIFSGGTLFLWLGVGMLGLYNIGLVIEWKKRSIKN